MPTYEVVCESCDAEYSVSSYEGVMYEPPTHCSYCGSRLNDDLVSENPDGEEDWDKDWDKLSEEGLDDLDDWKD